MLYGVAPQLLPRATTSFSGLVFLHRVDRFLELLLPRSPTVAAGKPSYAAAHSETKNAIVDGAHSADTALLGVNHSARDRPQRIMFVTSQQQTAPKSPQHGLLEARVLIQQGRALAVLWARHDVQMRRCFQHTPEQPFQGASTWHARACMPRPHPHPPRHAARCSIRLRRRVEWSNER